ncbi:ferredoxin--NADP reductase [Flammeovirga kamogawensis]|uniref:Ferredoxin--NADP reductase n=1 Tax=Flammeovirga kamogawensis TaxID=373891 RepID=A0ABX8GSF4_9BACT|nr:ferredoxin--NADP reductase [Flammeovirga kamogawensis]MBB6461454.1 ring-1,2-phenylacetyl-CoA epoxidase subunit PaaE [Flammeovirga kamogawensis]QWG06348.1 ferredoxin--NADP reductase [Flammeovirga kamogawensis]TRX68176.1 ferredoxin--NADP reductase [Flammeovirga kamogawensis]
MNQYTLKVKEVVNETADTVTIKFKQPLFKKVQYQSGQFLTIVSTIDDKKVRRSYSMSSTPLLDTTVDITVKRIEGGLVSNYLNDNVKNGDALEVSEPLGQFTFEPDKEVSRNLIFWGAGSGITPLFSMIKSALFFENSSKVTLVYGNRNEDSIIFKEQLEELKKKFEDRLEIVHVLSRPSTAWGGFAGRIDDVVSVNILNRLSLVNTVHYLCGPEGMMTAVKSALQRFKVPGNKIYNESFVPASGDEHSSDVSEQNVSITVDGDEHLIQVNPDTTILEAALDAGLDVPYSCQNGVCTACMGQCTSGKVEMGDSTVLSEQEKKDGYILTCISHPLTEDVKITYK